MRILKLLASDYAKFMWDLDKPSERKCTLVGQTLDGSAFLLMTAESEEYLVPNPDLSEFIFTYCQDWGLHITPEVVQRVWADLRSKSYPALNDQIAALHKGGEELADIQNQIAAVKAEFPKLLLS